DALFYLFNQFTVIIPKNASDGFLLQWLPVFCYVHQRPHAAPVHQPFQGVQRFPGIAFRKGVR
ncbi:hypothetical protein LJB63_27985, partial [[Eubacterium] rectale]|nr:hypothetical protein [Agathobacter rectalis]